MWKLTVRSPKAKPFDYVLKNGKNTLGRKSSNDIVILDESASRIHVEIDCQGDMVTITDLGSTNGTFVNQKRLIETQCIDPGDQIRIGYHLATLYSIDPSKEKVDYHLDDTTSPTGTRPLTPDFLLESYEQNAVLIYEVSNRLTTVLDLNKALQEITDFLLIGIGAEKCQIILAEQFNNLNELGFSETIAHQSIEQHSVVVYPDPEKPNQPSKSAQFLNIKTALCVPICNAKETVALVYAYKTDPNARPFDKNDIYLAVAVSHQAALTIQRTQILEKARLLEQWAFTDSLTGLDNRRQIMQKGEIECSRTNRYHHPLAVIMLDIDEIKEVNDTYGHPVGDQVLKAVGNRCQVQLRDVDLIGRFGGDEFLILLVETTLDEAIIVAERLSRKISETPVNTDRGQFNITISMGITYIKNEFADLDTLIRRADDALIVAKKRGKNNFEVLL